MKRHSKAGGEVRNAATLRAIDNGYRGQQKAANRSVRGRSRSMSWLELHAQLGHKVKIYLAPECRHMVDRVQASTGTRPVTSSEIVELHYVPEAHLPCEPWHSLTTDEHAVLIAERPPQDMARTVSIVKLPGKLEPDVWRSFVPIEGAEVPDEIVESLEGVCTLDDPLNWIGPTRNQPGLKTVTVGDDGKHYIGLHLDNWDNLVTVGNDGKRYIGLHLDSWDNLELARRLESTNRICVNIGASSRYFLFLPFSLEQMKHILSTRHQKASIHHLAIGDHFMEQFPTVPAIRCRLAPGEAYIAPTENLIHDGSSEGQQQPDQQFTVLGHIRPLSEG